MTHTPEHGSSDITPAEYGALRTEDRYAAAAIVCLMVGIFILGLIGYLAIAIWVA